MSNLKQVGLTTWHSNNSANDYGISHDGETARMTSVESKEVFMQSNRPIGQ